MFALQAGATLDDRFVLEEEANRGGMAVVFRATDLREQRRVAVKMLLPDTHTPFILDHFVREAEILATLRHPYIVSYIAHGSAADGAAYLVVEWLDGESLGTRLRRGPLSIAAAVQLCARLADALRTTHVRGIVHRDIKPDNIFLRHRELAQVALLDFGVAHLMRGQANRALTRTGEIIGTPEYMAPEQICGERNIGPATDLFALGCVLFECLAGQPPFSGGQVALVLTRILFEEAPDVRTLRPAVPESVVALLGRLLTKDPAARLSDGGALLAELAQLSAQLPEESEAPAVAAVRPSELRGTLKELLSIVVGRPADTGATTLAPAQSISLTGNPDGLRDALRALGGSADYLPDGSLVVVFRGAPSAVDQAVQGAQAALIVRERWPSARVAVATGRGQKVGLGPVGEAFDRAARLLLLGGTGGGAPAMGEALLDELTARLLAGRFLMTPARDGCFALIAAREAADESRPLLGHPTPCVGREGELAQLQGLLSATIDQSEASAVLITGAPGSGKSRLRHEFLRRIAAQGRGERVLLARGAPLLLGVPFALLAQALPGLGVQELPTGQDPTVAQEQLTRKAIALLGAACAAGPLVLVLEDLHWADAASVRILDAVLRALDESPLLLLGLSRPEVHERFPALWQHRRRFELPLHALPRRACERLIREVLGARAVAEVEARIIAQAAGNALFLEELIRAAAEGKGEGGPDTVLAMLQARLSRLPPESRTLVCAASIFGTTFWPGGVAALLARGDTEALASGYPHLLAQELIELQTGSRLAGEQEYRFRHDLVRDAAYGLLGEEDRAVGHELAARYLVAAGELDAFPIAEHFRLGGVRAEAALWYQRAAEQALAANELELCRERTERALAAGAQGNARGRLYGLQAEAAAWLGQDAETRRCAELAMELLAAGTAEWYRIAGHILVTSGRLRAWDVVERWLATVLGAEPMPAALAALALCLGRTGYMFMMQGRPAEMKRIAEVLAARVPELPDSEPVARAQVSHFLSGCAFTRGDYIAGLRHLEQTIADFARAGDVRSACLERSNLAGVYIEGGMPDAAVRLCRENLLACERARLPSARNLAQLMLGFALTFFPAQYREAAACLAEATERSAAAQHLRHEGWARSARARLHYLEGQPAAAAVEARAALRLTEATPTIKTWPLGWLARALVALGRPEEGLAYAEQALLILKTAGSFTMDVSVPQLAQLEALLALGRSAAAHEVAAAAQRRLQRRAERLSDPVWQARLLAHPENVQLLAHAAALQGQAEQT